MKRSEFARCGEAQGFQHASDMAGPGSGSPPGPRQSAVGVLTMPVSDGVILLIIRKEAVVISVFRKTGTQRHKGLRLRKRGREVLGIKTFVLAMASCSL